MKQATVDPPGGRYSGGREAGVAYWLVKSEPDVFGIEDLRRDGRTGWEGVRNFQARNSLRAMKRGDRVLYYHSNAEPSGIVGVAEVVEEASPDPFQFDPKSDYYDETSPKDDPRWSWVHLGFVAKFARVIPLAELKADPALAGLECARKGSRLSVHPVSEAHYARIVALGG